MRQLLSRMEFRGYIGQLYLFITLHDCTLDTWLVIDDAGLTPLYVSIKQEISRGSVAHKVLRGLYILTLSLDVGMQWASLILQMTTGNFTVSVLIY